MAQANERKSIMQLLGLSSTKTEKGEKRGYLTGILYMSPSTISGVDMCPMASEQCRALCLNTAGRGIMQPVQDGRLRKTRLFIEDRQEFKRQLREDISALVRKAERENMIPCVSIADREIKRSQVEFQVKKATDEHR